MDNAEQPEFDKPIAVSDDENGGTFAAIDQGLREAKEGRVVSAKQARKLVAKWTT